MCSYIQTLFRATFEDFETLTCCYIPSVCCQLRLFLTLCMSGKQHSLMPSQLILQKLQRNLY